MSDLGAAPVRPSDCALVEQNPPDFGWPYVASGPYTVDLTFPDGRTESRTATNNWLNWNGTLPAGNYAWTVTHAGVASLPRRFSVGANAVPFVVPDIEIVIQQLLAKPRPRGLPDSGTLSTMASQRDFELGQVRSSVDRFLPPNPPDELPADGKRFDGDGLDRYGMRALASLMAYVYETDASKKEAYKGDAKRRVLNLASWDPRFVDPLWDPRFVHPRGETAKDDQESRFVAWVITLGYDWLGPALSDDERRQVLLTLNTRIGDLYDWVSGIRGWPPAAQPPEFIPPPVWQGPRDSHRNITAAMVATMSALLVGDLLAAETWVRELLPLAINVTSPWSGEEGGYANGTAYSMWDVGFLLSTWYVLRLATCGSPACIDMAQKAWVRNWGRFITYFVPPTYPVGDHDDPNDPKKRRKSDPGTPIGLFGDGFADLSSLSEVRSPYAKGYTHFAPSALGCWYASSLARDDQWRIEYLMSPPNTCAAPAAFPSATPNSLYLPSIGWVAMHSDLADLNRTSVYFKSSPPPFGAFNHQSADQNAFVINAGGERLAIESGYNDGYKTDHWQYWVKRTRSKNAITFDGGQGQIAFEHLPFGSMGFGSIVRHRSTPYFDIVTGDATHAYNGALTQALRTLVFLRPGTILVYDKLASSTARTWEWNIHALNPFPPEVTSSSRRIRIARGTQSLCVDLLAGPPRQFAQTDLFTADPGNGAPPQYHGKFATTQASTTAEFLVLMRVNVPCYDLFAGTETQTLTARDSTASSSVYTPCDDREPTATKTNGIWTVQTGERAVTIAADGGITVGTSHQKRGRPDKPGRGKAC